MTAARDILPHPSDAWSMLAGWSAVIATILDQDDLGPESTGVAHFADGKGSEFDFALLSGGRATIVGFDSVAGDPDVLGADGLVAAGAPRWWFAALVRGATPPNFAFGFDGTQWSAIGDRPDLLIWSHLTPGPATIPSTTAAALASVVQTSYADRFDDEYHVNEAGIESALITGEHLDEPALRQILGKFGNAALGATTAARFRR